MFTPFTKETIDALTERFIEIHVYTPEPRPGKTESAFSLVFRACTPGEWENIMGQANREREKAASVRNLAKSSIVAVSVGGEQTIADLSLPDTRSAVIAPREAFVRLLARPGCVGIPEAVADALAELNGIVRSAEEKG